MSICLSARMQLFGRELVVVKSMAKMAAIEGQLGHKVELLEAYKCVDKACNLMKVLSLMTNFSHFPIIFTHPDPPFRRLQCNI